MIVELFDGMMSLLHASPGAAVAGSFLWGLASVLFSPCHLSGIPLVMGFIAVRSGGRQNDALQLSIIFAGGIAVSMLVLGLITGMMGRILGDGGRWSEWVGAAILLFVGLTLLDVIRFPAISLRHSERLKGGGRTAALFLGLLFGTVLGPCAFAFLMPVLALVFAKGADDPIFASGLILAYAIGHSLIIALAGSASAWSLRWIQRILDSPWVKLGRTASGILCILAALIMAMADASALPIACWMESASPHEVTLVINEGEFISLERLLKKTTEGFLTTC